MLCIARCFLFTGQWSCYFPIWSCCKLQSVVPSGFLTVFKGARTRKKHRWLLSAGGCGASVADEAMAIVGPVGHSKQRPRKPRLDLQVAWRSGERCEPVMKEDQEPQSIKRALGTSTPGSANDNLMTEVGRLSPQRRLHYKQANKGTWLIQRCTYIFDSYSIQRALCLYAFEPIW